MLALPAFVNTTEEISKRRTFAIISHPDAGKTTLTEKLLLYGGAVQLAGFKAGDQLLDLLFLREADGEREEIFFLAAAMCWRVSWMTRSA